MSDEQDLKSPMPALVDDEDKGDEEKDWDDWQADDDDDENNEKTLCVACSDVFDSCEACLAHIKLAHGFDLVTHVLASTHDASLRMYYFIKLVNYLRAQGPTTTIKIEGEAWKEDKYLAPVLKTEDPLLCYHIDEISADDAPFTLPTTPSQPKARPYKDLPREELETLLEKITAENSDAHGKLAYLEQHLSSLQRLNKALLDEEDDVRPRQRADSMSSDGSASEVVEQIDSGYFGSYAGFHIHEDMLKDKVRTEAYRDFIEGNPDLFADKVVLDVGCGTGILSMFAVRAGAKHVIAIDNSGIIERAKEIAEENGLSSKITFLRGKAESIEDLKCGYDKVDIIISEWMGYCLLFESMLPSVLFVRDRWLKPETGRVYPDISTLHLVGMAASEYRKARVDFWRKDVYGFSMESIAKRVHLEPGVENMQEYNVITDSQKFFEIDCNRVKPEQLDFESSFSLQVQEDNTLDCLVTYFDIGFIKDAKKPIEFTTSPQATETHWRQTVLILEQPLAVLKGDTITGTIQLKANRESFRDLDIKLTYRIGNGADKIQSFCLN